MLPVAGFHKLVRGFRALESEYDLLINHSNSAGINHAKEIVWTLVYRFRVRDVRSLTTVVLTVALLLPFLSGLVPVAHDTCCGMCSCKTARRSCPHRSQQGGHSGGAALASLPGCLSRCGQRLGLPSPLGAPSPGRCDFGAALTTSFLRPGATPSRIRRGAEFSLFERPPPFFS